MHCRCLGLPIVSSLLVALVIPLCIGCGDGLVEVKGKVTVAGEPVEDGTIRFVPVSGSTTPEGAVIANGEYSARITTGEKTVEIRGAKKVGERKHDPQDPSSPMEPVYQEVVPRRYLTNSDLKATIAPTMEEPLDFDLPAK